MTPRSRDSRLRKNPRQASAIDTASTTPNTSDFESPPSDDDSNSDNNSDVSGTPDEDDLLRKSARSSRRTAPSSRESTPSTTRSGRRTGRTTRETTPSVSHFTILICPPFYILLVKTVKNCLRPSLFDFMLEEKVRRIFFLGRWLAK